MITAVLFLVAEAAVLWFLNRVVRAFGAYTDAFVKAHESDRIVHQQLIKAVEYLDQLSQEEQAS